MKKIAITLLLLLSIQLVKAETEFSPTVTTIQTPDGRNHEVFAKTAVVTLKPGFGDQNEISNALTQSGAAVITPMLPEKASVTYHLSDKNYLNRHKNYDIPKALKCEEILLRTYIISYKENILPDKFCKKVIESNSAIEYASPYYSAKFQSYIPNDPHVPDQKNKFEIIHATDAWDITKGDPNVIIGISDNGVEQDHEDLNPNIAPNEGEIPDDGIDNDNNGYIDDFIGYNLAYKEENNNYGGTYNGGENHGCIVAGLAAAKTDNNIGVAGVGFNCRFFPIKIAHNSELLYSYKSIIYAAVRGCKVLNLSWGDNKTFDNLDQVVINYAISRDVAIVAAGGNIQGQVRFDDTFYPAGYFGVLGVGESTNTDIKSSGSVIGAPVAIMAPSLGVFSTSNHNDYQNEAGGTSFATPMVTGAVALVRSRFPELSAIQALQQVRLTADEIYQKEMSYPKLIPGRLNVYRAVTEDPMSKPALLPIKYVYYTNGGDTTKRFKSGDTMNMKIVLHNYLGSAQDLSFTLGKCLSSDNFEIIDSVVSVDSAPDGEDIVLNGFKIYVKVTSYDQEILRVDINAKGGFHDFFKFNFTPSSYVTDFTNGIISFSMSDEGSFGYSTDGKQGLGFDLKGFGNQLYQRSGLMVVSGNDQIMYNDYKTLHYDFVSIKGFVPPNSNINLLDDSHSGARIGVQVRTEVNFDAINYPNAAMLSLTLTNVGNQPLINPAIGYNFDFDVAGEVEQNTTSLLDDAIQLPLSEAQAVAVEMAKYSDNYPVFGAAAYSNYPGAIAQAAGINYDITELFKPLDRIKALTSGTSWQIPDTADVTIVSGMQFPGSIAAGDSLKCYICIAGAETEAGLVENLRNCILSKVNAVNDNPDNSDEIALYPVPVSSILNIVIKNTDDVIKSVEMYDNTGNLVSINSTSDYGALGIKQFSLDNLVNGVYFMKINLAGKPVFRTIVVNH